MLMIVVVQAVVVISVVLAVQGEAGSLFVPSCALLVELVGLVGDFPSVVYAPDLAARHIHVDDSGPLLSVGSVVGLYGDCTEPRAHVLLDTEVAAIVLVVLVVLTVPETYKKGPVAQGGVVRPVGLNSVVMVVSVVVALLIVEIRMVRMDVYCHQPHVVYHRDCVSDDLIVLVALYIPKLSHVCLLSVWFEHAILIPKHRSL